MVISAVVGGLVASRSSGANGPGICRGAESEGIGIHDADSRRRATQLQCSVDGEGLAVWVCIEDSKHTGCGTSVHGIDRNAVADRHAESGSHDALEILAR